LAESTSGGAFLAKEEANEDVALRVFVVEESFPAAVGNVVTPHKLNLVQADLEKDLVVPDFPVPIVNTTPNYFSCCSASSRRFLLAWLHKSFLWSPLNTALSSILQSLLRGTSQLHHHIVKIVIFYL
jgi:hypothetical protein